MLGQSPLFSESPATHTEEYWLLAVVLLIVRGHAVVAYSLLPTFLASVHVVLITSVLAQCLTVVELGVTLRTEEGGLHIRWGGGATGGIRGGVLGVRMILKR